MVVRYNIVCTIFILIIIKKVTSTLVFLASFFITSDFILCPPIRVLYYRSSHKIPAQLSQECTSCGDWESLLSLAAQVRHAEKLLLNLSSIERVDKRIWRFGRTFHLVINLRQSFLFRCNSSIVFTLSFFFFLYKKRQRIAIRLSAIFPTVFNWQLALDFFPIFFQGLLKINRKKLLYLFIFYFCYLPQSTALTLPPRMAENMQKQMKTIISPFVPAMV